MTDIAKAPHDELQRMKWQHQARKIAAELKGIPDFGEKTVIKAGIVFDDQIVNVDIPVSLIQRMNEAALAEVIFNGVLSVQNDDHRATGESADGTSSSSHPSGMECGHAAPQGNSLPCTSSEGLRHDGKVPPAAPAVFEQCRRRKAPDFTEQCLAFATGGVRLILFAADTIQKRYGRRPMLALILDLPLCDACFQLMTPLQVITDGLQPGQWGAIAKEAQRRNSGILPVRENSLIELIPFADPEYVALRAHIAKEHPNG